MPEPSTASHEFVRSVAEEYKAKEVRLQDFTDWDLYVEEIGHRWRTIFPDTLILVEGNESEQNLDWIRDAYETYQTIWAWGGGRFAPGHPLTKVLWLAGPTRLWFPAYLVSRAIHDIEIHVKEGLSFSFHDELRGALISREKFSLQAQRAQWTDDVAISCYREHFGEWPAIQRPIICEPDWAGLRRYLEEVK